MDGGGGYGGEQGVGGGYGGAGIGDGNGRDEWEGAFRAFEEEVEGRKWGPRWRVGRGWEGR